MLKLAYIISWFGQDDIREIRKEYHQKQLEWFIDRGFHVVVLAQEYKPEDYFNHSKVRYKSYMKSSQFYGEGQVLLPTAARNELLWDFYNTDADYAVFADNDAVLYDHGVGKDFEKFWDITTHEAIDFCVPTNPAREPFNEKFNKSQSLYRDNHVFNHVNPLGVKGSFFIIKNFYKHYEKLFFFNENFRIDHKLLPKEETDFTMKLIKEGFGVYRFENIVLKEFGADGSKSTWERDTTKRNVSDKDVFEKLNKKFVGVEFKDNKINIKKFLDKNNLTLKQIIVNIVPALDF